MEINRYKSIMLISVLTCAITIGICTPASAIDFGGIIPGMSSVNMKIASMRDMRFTNIVPQTFDFSCGAAAMATLLKYGFNYNIDEKIALTALYQNGDKKHIQQFGFSLLDLKNFALHHGFAADGYRLTVDQLRDVKVPAIVLMDIKGYKHFVVLKRVIGNQVYLADPALGNRVISTYDFSKQWNNILLIVLNKQFDPGSVLLNPKPPLSATKLFNITPQPMTNGLDFGSSAAGYF